ncbi:MAG: Serine/threonine protein kinase PrkC, regulator of stationary phase [Myxococcales bacterium]|nr:Serine/threonine protein kinase PrkC, regulator of stationary phase [Myxococcales bacterium]
MVDDSETKATVARAPAGEQTADGDLSQFAATAPAEEATTGEPTIIPTWGAGEGVALPDPGYQLGELIGRGGMGEVMVANDQRIGREVAVKRIRSRQPSPDAVTRFLREARIQARLDHPAIVPVYELGTDADGRPYFTMKRLAGVTLAKQLEERGPVQPLLRAFIDVCLAIRLAHARGVVHRDLKPSNIMLGDFGEVYVLDWGVARVLTDRRRTTRPGIADDVDEGTTAGAILGTPGYMSPEQVRGHEVGTPADVYALGSLLFEILAGEPLHPRGGAALASTLTRPQEAPAKRASARPIPPELDAVCFDALAEDPNQRPTARELADRVQAYLDGDRDVERRRTLAAEQLDSAHEALASESDDGRSNAMRYAGRALALDPESEEAAALVTSLILEPPKHLPAALVENLRQDDRLLSMHRSKQAGMAVAGIFFIWAFIPFLHVRSWTILILFFVAVSLLVGSSWLSYRRGYTYVPVLLVLNLALIVLFTRVAGPFVLTPIVICGMLLTISGNPWVNRHRWVAISWAVIVVLLPFALEWTGVLNTTWEISGGLLITRSDTYALKGVQETIGLFAANFVFILIIAIYAISLSRNQLVARRALQIREWHLRQLLPGTAAQRPSEKGMKLRA